MLIPRIHGEVKNCSAQKFHRTLPLWETDGEGRDMCVLLRLAQTKCRKDKSEIKRAAHVGGVEEVKHSGLGASQDHGQTRLTPERSVPAADQNRAHCSGMHTTLGSLATWAE